MFEELAFWSIFAVSNQMRGATLNKKYIAVNGAFCRLLWAVAVSFEQGQKRAVDGFFIVQNK